MVDDERAAALGAEHHGVRFVVQAASAGRAAELVLVAGEELYRAARDLTSLQPGRPPVSR